MYRSIIIHKLLSVVPLIDVVETEENFDISAAKSDNPALTSDLEL